MQALARSITAASATFCETAKSAMDVTWSIGSARGDETLAYLGKPVLVLRAAPAELTGRQSNAADQRVPSPRFFRYRTPPVPVVLALFLAAGVALLDFATWIQLNVSILYALPLILAAQARSRRLLWSLAGALGCATFTVYWLQIPPGHFALHEPFFVNRVLASGAMVITAVLLHVWINAANTVDAQDRHLKEQNGELQRLRHEAEEASGRKTQLLTSISHDLRSPINSITLTADLIRRTADDTTLSADIPRLALRLKQNAQSLADFLDNTLDRSAFESGRLVLNETEFSLNEVLSAECSRLLPLAELKHLKLTWQGPEPPISLKADRTKLVRILTNLLTNAIKFTETGEVIVEATLTPDRMVEVRVRDTGIGIASEDLNRVFDDFAQFGRPAPDPNKGWGLGLPICQRLVKLMGGTITVQSQPQIGTIFTVRLPAPSSR